MRVLQIIVSLVVLLCSITASSVKEDNAESYDSTDMTFLYDSETDGLSKSATVDTALTWPDTFAKYYEETGEDNDILEENDLGRNGLADEAYRWENATVPYLIIGPFSKAEENMIMKAIYTIQFWTCVRFVKYRGEADFLVIKHVKGLGCKSQTGRKGGRQLLFLEARKCFYRIGKVLHELLHALGIIHEHGRPDRDDYVTILKQNILPGRENSFKIATSKTDNFGIPYDYNSVMHYPERANAIVGQKTIAPKLMGINKSSRLGQRIGLTVRDVTKINIMYNCYFAINKAKTYSKVLPNDVATAVSKVQLWNTYFRNFDYTK